MWWTAVAVPPHSKGDILTRRSNISIKQHLLIISLLTDVQHLVFIKSIFFYLNIYF